MSVKCEVVTIFKLSLSVMFGKNCLVFWVWSRLTARTVSWVTDFEIYGSDCFQIWPPMSRLSTVDRKISATSRESLDYNQGRPPVTVEAKFYKWSHGYWLQPFACHSYKFPEFYKWPQRYWLQPFACHSYKFPEFYKWPQRYWLQS